MNDSERLPAPLVFEPDGHLTEVALACVADGEIAIVPAIAIDHLSGCEDCTQRLGEAALLSLDAGVALRLPAPEADSVPQAVAEPIAVVPQSAPVSPRRRRRPLPIAAIAAALALAVVAAGPALLAGGASLPRAIAGALDALPSLTHVLITIVRAATWGAGPAVAALEWISALMFVGVGLSVARLRSRDQSLQGGV